MITPQRFQKGVAAVFKFKPLYGRPDAAPQITLYNPDGTVLQAATAMTMAAATATDDTAPDSSNDKLMSVADASTFSVGDTVYAINNLAQIEYPLVDGVDASGNDLYFERELKHTYANGDVIAKHDCTYALTTTHTATSGKYYSAKITYDVGGVAVQPERIPFHVRNRVFASNLRVQDLYDHFPDLGQFSPNDIFQNQIDAAFDRIYMDLESDGIDLDLFRGGFFEQAHLYKTLSIIGERWIINQRDIEEWFAYVTDTYAAMYAKLSDRITYYDANDDDVVDTGEFRHETGYNARPDAFEYDNPFGWDDDQLKSEDDDYEQY